MFLHLRTLFLGVSKQINRNLSRILGFVDEGFPPGLYFKLAALAIVANVQTKAGSVLAHGSCVDI